MASPRPRLLSLVSIALLLLASCGTDRSPITSPEATPAAKLPIGGITVSGVIGLVGGTLTAIENGEPGPQDDVRVDFRVKSGSLNLPTLITMRIYNNALGELVADFAPDGLNFLVTAELDVRQGEDLVEVPVGQITAWHEHGDGTVEEAAISYRSHIGQTVRVKVDVPGFSRYGVRNR